MLPDDVRCLFIVGLPRSGTTWLFNLFTAHPHTVTLRPAHIGKGELLYDDGEHDVPSLETGCFLDVEPEKTEGAIGRLHYENPGKLIVEKTPFHMQRIKAIFTMAPTAQVLCIERDRAAMLTSYVKHLYGRSLIGAGDVERAWWQAAMAVAHNLRTFEPYRAHPRVRTVSYEDMCERGAERLMQLQQWAGLQPTLEPLELHPARNANDATLGAMTPAQREMLDRYLGGCEPCP